MSKLGLALAISCSMLLIPAHASAGVGETLGSIAGRIMGWTTPRPIPDGGGSLPGLLDPRFQFILEVLREINDVIGEIREASDQVSTVLRTIYPNSIVDTLSSEFEPIGKVRTKVAELEGEWDDIASERIRGIQRRMLSGQTLRQEDVEGVMGSVPVTSDQDLEGWYDFQMALRLGSVADSTAKSDSWVDEQAKLITAAKEAGSVGMAERQAALGAAALGNHLIETNKLEGLALDLAIERSGEKRRRRRVGHNFAVGLYTAMVGGTDSDVQGDTRELGSFSLAPEPSR